MNLEFLHEENQPTRCEFNWVRSFLSPETKQKKKKAQTVLQPYSETQVFYFLLC